MSSSEKEKRKKKKIPSVLNFYFFSHFRCCLLALCFSFHVMSDRMPQRPQHSRAHTVYTVRMSSMPNVPLPSHGRTIHRARYFCRWMLFSCTRALFPRASRLAPSCTRHPMFAGDGRLEAHTTVRRVFGFCFIVIEFVDHLNGMI